MSITDGILSILTGEKIETFRTPREEMAELVNRFYIKPASTPEEYGAVRDTIKGGLMPRELESKDGRYNLRVVRNTAKHNWVWIIDTETNRRFEYKCTFYRKFKNLVNDKIAEASQEIRASQSKNIPPEVTGINP